MFLQLKVNASGGWSVTKFNENEAEIVIFLSKGHWNLSLELLLQLWRWLPLIFSSSFLLAPYEVAKADRFPLLAGLDWVAFLLANHLEGTESIKLMHCTCTFGNLHSKWNGHQVLVTQFLSVLWYLMKCSKQTFTWGNIPPRAHVLPPPPLQGTPGSDGVIIFSKVMLIAISTDTYFPPPYARRLH